MKYLFSIVFVLSFIGLSNVVKAQTWDEPWQKEIIEQSDYLVLGKITANSGEEMSLYILENIGGNIREANVIIDGYFLFRPTGVSDKAPNFSLKKDQLYYLFLKKNDKGNYSLPTPTSGFAILDEDHFVEATYRHSYHKAILPQNIYEFTYRNIWNYYKTKKFDKKQVNDFLYYYLALEPAGFGENEIDNFYHQHAAMETAYLVDLSVKFEELEKFVTSENFHLRVSAIQLLGNDKSKNSKNYLIDSQLSELHTNFEKVLAIWALKKIGDEKYIQQLKLMSEELSPERMGFGGKQSDPRSGTSFPSPKEAVEKL